MNNTINERTWRKSSDPLVLLEHLYPMRSQGSGGTQDRAPRHYLLACARRVWNHLPAAAQVLVEVSERFVECGKSSVKDLVVATLAAEQLLQSIGDPEAIAEVETLLRQHGLMAAGSVANPAPDPKMWPGLAYLVYYPFSDRIPHFQNIPAEFHSCELIREIFGNPFRDIALFPPSWRSSVVVSMARGMYRSRDFSPMPILRDALIEAGCDDAAVLEHSEKHTGHVRGCWVIERILRGITPVEPRG